MKNRMLLGLLALALVAAACSPSEPGADPTTTSLSGATTTIGTPATTTTLQPTTTQGEGDGQLDALMASLAANATITSARMEGSIEITGLEATDSGPSDMTILFRTAFDSVAGNSLFLMDMSSLAGSVEIDESDPFAALAAGLLGEMEFRQIGDRTFVKFPFFTAMFGVETDWVSMPTDEGEEFTSGFETMPTDPGEILEAYREADATVEDLGAETVNGVEATHYRVTFDLEALELSAEERAELEESGIFADGVVPMDLWISDEGYLVRMGFELDGSQIDAPPGEGFERMVMRYDVFDINQPVTIEPPPESDVTDFEDIEGFDMGFGFEG